ncbi:M56 family metallopeptidase [Streptomyces sp. NPDC037389]|uniref:M56 family metallopeptidase n=1 Tax=Streptomyces sp. NPDC037389 TaxID=3155369 RepID=UPI0034090004
MIFSDVIVDAAHRYRIFTVRRVRAWWKAVLDAACFPGDASVVVTEDAYADAYAMPGLPGRVVVSTGMLAALDPAEREALLAHERAHLRGHHYLFTAAVQTSAAANPLLRPPATAVSFTVERWADEHAATVCRDRRPVARAVGKAAIAAKRTGHRRIPAAALGLLGRGREPAVGPVPRRVAALLAPPPRNHPGWVWAAALLMAATVVCALEAMHDLHKLLEPAELS